MSKILAIVVTYNRLDCLRHCLNALTAQTYKDFDVLVVNNGSTDGTGDFLNGQNYVLVINQENLGGAGGFYSGMKYAFENDYDWIWMMDDDGIPENHQLENLLSLATRFNFYVLNALVVNKDNHNLFAFGRQEPLSSVNLSADYLPSPLSPFNGTFIHRSVIEKIGYIKKEMFIWGDEQEYMARIRNFGYVPYTVPQAIHYHPREKGIKDYVFPFVKKGVILIKPKHMSFYYYRNMGYIDVRYKGWVVSMKHILLYTMYFIRKCQFSELAKFILYYFKGRKNDYR